MLLRLLSLDKLNNSIIKGKKCSNCDDSKFISSNTFHVVRLEINWQEIILLLCQAITIY